MNKQSDWGGALLAFTPRVVRLHHLRGAALSPTAEGPTVLLVHLLRHALPLVLALHLLEHLAVSGGASSDKQGGFKLKEPLL